ncbi:MAG: hypothetical protein WCH10_02770 [bacterium]
MNPKKIFFFLSLFATTTAFAICPLCTFAVGAGIGLAQYLGIDDTITGIWVGGLVVSLIAWTIHWLDKKNVHFYGRKIFITIVYYALTIVPLYIYGIMGHALNKMWGIDKILLGIIVGSIIFFSGVISYGQLKKKNNDKAYFPFQKVIIPIWLLIILSIVFYYVSEK